MGECGGGQRRVGVLVRGGWLGAVGGGWYGLGDGHVTPRVAERSDASLEDDAKAEVRGVGTSFM